MKNVSSSDLLSLIDQNLISGYQRKHSSCQDLAKINKKYDEWKKLENKRRCRLVAVLVVLLCWIVLLIAGLSASIIDTNLTSILFVGPFLVIAYMNASLGITIPKDIKESRDKIANFREVVEDMTPLDPPLGMYCREYAKDTLVDVARQLLRAETYSKEVRSRVNVDTSLLHICSDTEMKERFLFNKTFDATEKFDLQFKKSKIFEIAKRHPGL